MKQKRLVSLIGMLLLLFMHTSCAKNDKVILLNAWDKNDLDTVEKIFSNFDQDNLKQLTDENSSPGGDFSYTLSNDETWLTITGYNGPGGLVIIPSEIEGYPVKIIGKEVFKDNDLITSVIISSGIKIIGAASFYKCHNLAAVLIPSSILGIGDQAFFGCDSLSIVKMMHGVETISRQSFSQCNNLTRIVIPESVKEISSAAFRGWENLTEVRLSDTIEYLSSETFSQCTNLHTINIPKNIKSISTRCFKNCIELYNLEIPEEIKAISFYQPYDSDAIFEGCKKLPIATRKRLKALGYNKPL